MKLYCDPISTSSRPVIMLVADFDLPVEIVTINLFADQNQTPDFLAINPLGTVPVLEDDGFVLTESAAILKYLSVRFDLPVYPSELQAQIRVDEMLARFISNFNAFHGICGTYPRMLPQLAWLNEGTKAQMTALGAYGSARYLSVLDRRLAQHGPFVCGAELSIADYAGVSLVTLADFVEFDFSPYPAVQAWLARMRDRAGWDAAFAGFTGMVTAARAARAEPAA
jgi:glutathione S-transferase